MNVQMMTLFFALLSGLAAAIAAAVAISAASGDRLGLVERTRPIALELAAAVATAATLGSLYLSEGAGYEPCRLCWVQRGFMYPSAVLLLAALVLGRRGRTGSGSTPGTKLVTGLVGAAGLLAVIGLPVSLFHRYEQAVGGVGDFCDQANPCSARWVNEFGFVTIPTMAAAGFAAIIVLCTVELTGRVARNLDPNPIDPSGPEPQPERDVEFH